MELQLFFSIIANVSIILGILFGLIQLGHYHKSRTRDSAITLLNSYQTAEFSRGIWKVLAVSDVAIHEDMGAVLGEDMATVFNVMNTWESIGFLVFQNEFTLEIVDETYGCMVVFSWDKLENTVLGMREKYQLENLFQWFQWLAERIADRQKSIQPIPAYIKYKDWDGKNKADLAKQG